MAVSAIIQYGQWHIATCMKNATIAKWLLNCDSKLYFIPQFLSFDKNFKDEIFKVKQKPQNAKKWRPQNFQAIQ